MNYIEKVFYDLVKNNPSLKFAVRNTYQFFFDLLPRQKNIFSGKYELREGYFFGFHDVSPFDSTTTRLLANKLTIPNRMPLKGEELIVGYFPFDNGEMGEFVECGTSLAWNYHKGCRLQWLDNDRIVYNTAVNDSPAARITDVSSGKSSFLDFPVDAVSYGGKMATSFSYERLEELMPGYGYANYKDDSYLDLNMPEETGLFLADIDNNTKTLLVSLKELADEANVDDDSMYHYVTHTEFSHDNRYISFLHRWVGKDRQKRSSRLVIYDLQEKIFFPLPTDLMASHYVWNKKNQIVAYCRVNGKDGHFVFGLEPEIKTSCATTEINSDGHQTFISDSVFITDTYPDRRRMAHLLRVDMGSEAVKKLASVYSPKKFQTKDFKKHIACDLHPRCSPDGRFVCFDTVFSGVRGICVMSL